MYRNVISVCRLSSVSSESNVSSVSSVHAVYGAVLVTSISDGVFLSDLFQVTCVLNVENWTKWVLTKPVFYIKYGSFR